MVSIDEMQEMIEQIAGRLPQELFNRLNGGILLLPGNKRHPESVGNDLFVLGEYYNDSRMGRYIAIYYGSFERVYGWLPPDKLMEKLEETVKHEFRHHLESMGGERDLEIEDEAYIRQYLQEKGRP